MAKKEIEFVVARFNEDLSWLRKFASYCTVYNKGEAASMVDTSSYRQCLELPNIGREGHTYLYHIISRYKTLADVTVFLQGRIDDHIELDISDLRFLADKIDDTEVLTFPPRQLEFFDAWDGMHGELLPGCEEFAKFQKERREQPRKPVMAPNRPGNYFARFLGGGRLPWGIGFQPAAMFGVPKQLILSRPLAFYQELFSAMFTGPMAVNDPETGHFLERFWLSIFNPEEYICWSESEVSKNVRNFSGQLAKGRWLRSPQAIVKVPTPISKEPTPVAHKDKVTSVTVKEETS